jgi:hypothetical protein
LKKLGVSKSGMYLIDPDGAGVGDAPFMAECDMSGTSGMHYFCKFPDHYVFLLEYQIIHLRKAKKWRTSPITMSSISSYKKKIT